MRRIPYLLVLAAGLIAWMACSDSGDGGDGFSYAPFPADADFPVAQGVIDGWVASGDQEAIDAHAWDIWAWLTADSGESYNGVELPVWETWFAKQEIFTEDPVDPGGARETPRLFHEIDQQQVGLAPGQDNPEEEVSGVRYNLETVEHILDNEYQLQSTLSALNEEFDEAGTPALDRNVEAFPPSSVAIKPVYAIIAAEGLTPLPVWDGPGGKDQSNSGPSTWSACVLVDPQNEVGGGTASGDCNGTVGDLAVVDLDDFYHFPLTEAEIRSLRDKVADGCIGCGKAQAGDYAAFLAMHVTTREIERWTWQTFWWIPDDRRSDPPSSLPDPPAEVTGVWRNYTGCTAYSMVLPPQPITGGSGTGTEALLCYNPYLEPGLGAPVVGVQTNCMACHANANWSQTTASTVPNAPAYVNDMYVDLGGEQFADVARVDFLWSVSDTAIGD